jgi:hypothetical protein
MKLRSAFWPLLCVALATLGCAKGDTGPTGPTGLTGPAGPTGPAGSANVIYSSWYSPATWGLETVFGTVERYYTMSTTSLTQQIIDRGVVMVYMRFAGYNPEVYQLPAMLEDVGLQFSFRAQAGSIKVTYYLAAARASTPSIIPSSNQVRFVLIPGGAVAATMQANGSTYEQALATLKSLPYSEVCRKYGVPE